MGALVCRVELDKEKGLILTVENKDGKITQTAVLDGKTITITCKGDEDSSTITQKPDGISMECKEFILNAETITCKSTKSSLYKSDETMDIESTKDMTLNSSGKLTGQATSDTKISGSNVSISASATGKAELKGASTTIEATTGKTEVKGMDLKLSGTTKAEMDGLKVAISSNTMLDLKASAIVNLEGQMANVKGTLTKVG